jgi:hypothetical protein
VIVTVSLDGWQEPLLIVQANLLAPTLKLATPELGEAGVETAPPPATTVQTPVPTDGAFPASVAEVEQIV